MYTYIHVEKYKTISETRTPLLIKKFPKGVHNDNGEIPPYFCINQISHLQFSSEVSDPQLDRVGTIPELLQAAGLLLPLPVAVVLVDCSAVV